MAKIIDTLKSTIKKALRVDPGRNAPIPRKGLFSFTNMVTNKKQQKKFTINSATLGRLANTDPVIWAIRRVIKGYISQTKWDIVPDTDCIETELDRWEDAVITSINPYGLDTGTFRSTVLPTELQDEVRTKLSPIVTEIGTNKEKREAVRWYFKTLIKRIRQEAESHKEKVKCIFEHPNDTESSFRTLLELVLDDILIYDAGVIVKNNDRAGNLAEIYTIPGQDIKIYRNEDRTIPVAPEPAYIWEDKGIARAEFTNGELLYIMQNPQQNGYGLSPLEVAAFIITASLYAEQYNIDYFKNSNVPPGVLNLGEGVTEDQRRLYQKMWEQEIQGRGGQHNLIFTAGSDNIKFIPMRVQSNRDMQMMEYIKWTVGIKAACYGISPQDIGLVSDFHRTTGEVQERLSQARGINTLLNLLASFFNQEIVKCEFGFKDVKFEWQITDKKESIQQAQIDKLDIDTGVISINERRKKLGKKPIEGGDEINIKTGAGMIPVKELERAADPIEQQPQPSAVEQLLESTRSRPSMQEQVQVQGNAGRPTLSEEQQNADNLNISVNRNQKLNKQHKDLNVVIEELKKKGINTTLKIGFQDESK